MRTTIEIDDALMEMALQANTEGNKRKMFEAALELYIQRQAQRELRNFRGAEPWVGTPPRRR